MTAPRSFSPLAQKKGEGEITKFDSELADGVWGGSVADPGIAESMLRYFGGLGEFSSDYLQGQADALQWVVDNVSMKLDDETHLEAMISRLRAEIAERKEGGS
jgi:hypothetical protein